MPSQAQSLQEFIAGSVSLSSLRSRFQDGIRHARDIFEKNNCEGLRREEAGGGRESLQRAMQV